MVLGTVVEKKSGKTINGKSEIKKKEEDPMDGGSNKMRRSKTSVVGG